MKNDFKTKQGPTAKGKDQSVTYPSKVLRKGAQVCSTTAMQITNTNDKYVSTLFISSET